MTPSSVPDTLTDPATDVGSPASSGPISIVNPSQHGSRVDTGADETAPLRAAVHALTMHATIHAGIAEWEHGLHDGSPPTTVADELHALVAAQAPRHQGIADAAHQLAATLRAVVDGHDQTHPTRIHGLRHDATAHPDLTALYRQARELLAAHRWLLPEFHEVLDNLPLDHPGPTPTT